MTTDELKGTHWQTLKKMMEDAGLEFKSKEQAIEALSKLQGDDQGGTENNPGPESTGDETTDAAPAAPASGPRLNRSKPHGTVHGRDARFPNAAFAQGGRYFDADGNLVGKA